MKKQIVNTKKAPEAIGPYSQAIKSGDLIFCSGQIPLRPDGSLETGDIKAQTKQVMENLNAVIEEAGSSLDKVVKTTIYCTNLNDFHDINEVYGSYFEEPYPARATVQVAALPKGVEVEIDLIAAR